MSGEADPKNEKAMRFAIRTLYGIEIVGNVEHKWWPHVARANAQARSTGSVCSCCHEKKHLSHISVAQNPDDPKDGRFFHLCKDCGEDPEKVEATRQMVLALT